MTLVGHGIGGVRDLPVPESFFFSTAAIVLVVSFVILGALWRRPQLERRAEGRDLRWVCSDFCGRRRFASCSKPHRRRFPS